MTTTTASASPHGASPRDFAHTPEALVVAEQARLAAAPRVLEPLKVHALTTASGVQIVDLNEPTRLRALGLPCPYTSGTFLFHRTDSFIAYLQRHTSGKVATCELWAEPPECSDFSSELHARVVAVLNSDQPGESPVAGWADWRAELRLPLTPEWRTWLAVAGKDLSQLEFADFLEDHRLDVKDPDGANLLEIVTNITATRTAHFAQAQNLADGRIQFQVSEGLETRAGKAHTLTIPNSISLGLRPFAGGDAYRLDARLRYRINAEKGLSLSLRLDCPDDVITHAFDQVVERITEQTGLPIYYGEPAIPHFQLLRHQQSAAPQSL